MLKCSLRITNSDYNVFEILYSCQYLMGQNMLLCFPANFLYPGTKAASNYSREIRLGSKTAHTVYVSGTKLWPGN